MLGIYLTGAFLSDQVVNLLVHWHLISTTNPFDLLTLHATNADLLVASRQLFLALMLLTAERTEAPGKSVYDLRRKR